MKIGALIPARMGSKRLPGKNIKLLMGKPLICWTIDVLLSSGQFNDITVSSESDEVEAVVKKHYPGGQVLFLKRPRELASDDASLSDVCKHYLQNRPHIEWYGLFMPTYPFRRIERIFEAVNAIRTRYPWRVISATREAECTLDYYYPVHGGVKRFFHEPALYCSCCSSCYLFYHRLVGDGTWAKYGLTITERLYKILVDLKEEVDIDTSDDFALAEKLAPGKELQLSPVQETDLGKWRMITPVGTNVDAVLDFIGKDKLNNTETPIMFLEKPKHGLNTLRTQEGSIRRYWMGPEAQDFFNIPALKTTGNSVHIPLHYKSVGHYRLLRKLDSPNRWPSLSSDKWGVEYGLDHSIIPDDRIVIMDDLCHQSFYIKPYVIAKRR